MEEQIKLALLQLAKQQQDQLAFMQQLSADLAALKNAVFALDAHALPLFEEQLRKIHDIQRQALESVRRETESLIQTISKIKSQEPN